MYTFRLSKYVQVLTETNYTLCQVTVFTTLCFCWFGPYENVISVQANMKIRNLCDVISQQLRLPSRDLRWQIKSRPRKFRCIEVMHIWTNIIHNVNYIILNIQTVNHNITFQIFRVNLLRFELMDPLGIHASMSQITDDQAFTWTESYIVNLPVGVNDRETWIK